MKSKVTKFLMLVILFTSLFASSGRAPVSAKGADSEGVSPKEFLNPDGTLNLDGSFSGTLDLSGYSVGLDPERGPVLGQEGSALASVTAGNWAALGDGGGIVDGTIRAILVNGTDVYVGGNFTNLASNPAADYVAKWDGANWSALGSDSLGDGALNNDVNALAMNGTDLYVGGSFAFAYNGGTQVSSAANIAKWDGSNWSALGNNGAGGGSLNASVTEIAVSGSNVYAGGYFTDVNNGGTILTAADYVAKWDGSNWSALGSNGASNGSLSSGAYIGALAVSGTDLYVGGSFTDVNNGGTVIPEADRIAKWDGTNWSALGSNGAGNGSIGGTVYSLAVSGTTLYVGGQFSNVNNNGVVLTDGDYLVQWDGTNWSALGSNGSGNGSLNSYPMVLVVSGTDLYAGGGFTNVNNNGTVIPEADYLAKWDGSAWSAIGSNGAGDGAITNKGGPFIFALALQGSNLLAGGFFFDLNDGGTVLPQADHLAQWNGTNWSSLGSDTNGALVGGYANNLVNAIAIVGTDVYVGGRFTNISNHGVNIPEGDYIAKWDSLTGDWSALGSNGAGDGALFNIVYAFAVSGTDLYVGGQFINVNNNGTSLPTADYVAKWDTLTNSWSALGSNGAGNGSLPASVVYALAINGTDLYVGGSFTNVNNGGTPIPEADYIAKWDGSNWSALGNNGAGDGALNGYVAALTLSELGDLYAGGGFTNAANLAEADYIAKWDGTNWSALGSNGAGDGSLNNGITAIAVNEFNIYAGGFFTNVNNNGTSLGAADYIAKWDGTNWSALGNNGFGNGSLNSAVRVIAVSGTDVYVGGMFANVNNNGVTINAADHIARWDGTNWYALGSNGAGNGSINGNNDIVYALLVNGTDLLVGGQFSNVNNNGTVLKEADYLAAYGMDSAPDLTPPTVVSITRADPNPTNAANVDFTVTFSEDVYFPFPQNVFSVTATGVSGATVVNNSHISSVYTITVNTGSGNGSIRLDVVDDDSVVDAAGNPLGGTGTGNGDFTSGESYTVNKTVTLTVKSNGTSDGWILESSETSGNGGTMNSAATNFYLGDNAQKKQYRAILSFDTSSIPDNAVITKVTLKLKKQDVTGGGNPVSMFQGFVVDIKKGMFGTAPLQLGDFKVAASKTLGPASPALTTGWYTLNLTPAKGFINKLTTGGGLTQIRLRFKLDDNNNTTANFLKIYSGNAGAANRPQLIVEYYVP